MGGEVNLVFIGKESNIWDVKIKQTHVAVIMKRVVLVIITKMPSQMRNLPTNSNIKSVIGLLYVDRKYGERLEKITDIENILENILIGRQCFTIGDLANNGNDVMRTMRINEGKDVVYWLNEILNRVMDGALKNDRNELVYWMTGITDGWIKF